MGKRKENGVIDLHLKFYPDKFEAHRKLIDLLRSYQEATGLGLRDAFAMMIYCSQEPAEQKVQKVNEKPEKEKNLTQRKKNVKKVSQAEDQNPLLEEKEVQEIVPPDTRQITSSLEDMFVSSSEDESVYSDFFSGEI